jgi:hypothetical protein
VEHHAPRRRLHRAPQQHVSGGGRGGTRRP